MKTRKSFFIRWTKALDSNKNQISIVDLEYVQSGESWRVSTIEDAAEMIKQIDGSEPGNEKKSLEESK